MDKNSREDKGIVGESEQPKWDYTNREQTLFTGALVVFLNLLVVLGVILDRTVPAVHSFITGKPM